MRWGNRGEGLCTTAEASYLGMIEPNLFFRDGMQLVRIVRPLLEERVVVRPDPLDLDNEMQAMLVQC